MALNYANYIKLHELVGLQHPVSKPPEHDEVLFIIIHQTYELWFRLLLHEFTKLKQDFSTNDLYGAIHTLKRCRTVMKTLVGQMDILETMTPMSFSSFRERLETASGFQSHQFREFEFMLGYKRPQMMKYHEHDSRGYQAIAQRLNERSVWSHFYDFLEHQGVPIPPELRAAPVTEPTRANDQIQEALLKLYKTRPDLAGLFELMTDFDEGFQEWRYRHVKLVERTIGNKEGTAGTLGVEFLKRSLFQPTFPDLWAIRHKL